MSQSNDISMSQSNDNNNNKMGCASETASHLVLQHAARLCFSFVSQVPGMRPLLIRTGPTPTPVFIVRGHTSSSSASPTSFVETFIVTIAIAVVVIFRDDM